MKERLKGGGTVVSLDSGRHTCAPEGLMAVGRGLKDRGAKTLLGSFGITARRAITPRSDSAQNVTWSEAASGHPPFSLQPTASTLQPSAFSLHPRRGFTLIELLIVVAILAAIAASAVALVDATDDGFRFRDTHARLLAVEDATMGPDRFAPAGGYLADVGWLPGEGADLLRAPSAVDGTEVPLPAYGRDAKWGQYCGWRGPYLTTQAPREGEPVEPYDGWGRTFVVDAAGTGWSGGTRPWDEPFATAYVDPLDVRSLGADAAAGGETDLPADPPLVAADAWHHDLTGTTILIRNAGGGPWPTGGVTVRAKVTIPHWEALDSGDTGLSDDAKRTKALDHLPASLDAWEHVSFESLSGTIPPNGEESFAYGDTGGGTRLLSRVPCGRWAVVLINETTGDPVVGAEVVFIELGRLGPTPDEVEFVIR